MKSSRICKFFLAALFVPLTMGAFVALAPRLTQTNAVGQIANGPVPWPPTTNSGVGNG